MDNGDKPLPYNEDAEKGVLCSLIIAPKEAGNICAQRLSPDHFYSPAHKDIYKLLFKAEGPEPLDFYWLKEELKKRGQLKEIGGPEFLNELYTFVPTGANASYYIDGVLDAWQRRSTILECWRREKAAFDESSQPVHSTLTESSPAMAIYPDIRLLNRPIRF